MGKSIIVDKAKNFAVCIIGLYKYLITNQREFIISRQILKSGTAIGANIHDAIREQSSESFGASFEQALNQASQTQYWLELLYETGYIEQKTFGPLHDQSEELVHLLTRIVNSVKKKKAGRKYL